MPDRSRLRVVCKKFLQAASDDWLVKNHWNAVIGIPECKEKPIEIICGYFRMYQKYGIPLAHLYPPDGCKYLLLHHDKQAIQLEPHVMLLYLIVEDSYIAAAVQKHHETFKNLKYHTIADVLSSDISFMQVFSRNEFYSRILFEKRNPDESEKELRVVYWKDMKTKIGFREYLDMQELLAIVQSSKPN